MSRFPGIGALVLALCASVGAGADEAYRVGGEKLVGTASGDGANIQIGEGRLALGELLVLSFGASQPPARLASGVFLRDGSLLVGELESLVGDKCAVAATSLGRTLELPGAQVAGAFFPLPASMPENFQALGNYARLIAALREPGAPGDGGDPALSPGRRNRVTYRNMERLDGVLQRLKTNAFIALAGGASATPDREVLRVVEFKLPAEPSPPPKGGLEVVVRMKAGDVLRGRLVKLDAKELTLATSFAGNLALPRQTLAVLYLVGGPEAGLVWLSALKPASDEHTPTFDAKFPTQLNLSCDGRMLRMSGLVCDRGLGVHARSRVTFAVDGRPGLRFTALVGIDDETQGRGEAEARVLVDGRVAWQSGPLTPGKGAVPVLVDLAQAKALTLEADFGPDGDDSGDHVDWGWAALVGK